MKIKQILSYLFWSPISSKAQIEIHQERIRLLEWNAVKSFIPAGAHFLDVGCGAGYSLIKAHTDLGCQVQGIDPSPGVHGVGRYTEGLWKDRPILQGSAENLPFDDGVFDVVYSSHVLEHVDSEIQALEEMKRVLKPGGVLIVGMPTAAMSWVALFSVWLLTSHISIYFFLKSIGNNDVINRFISIFIPRSHSYPRANFIWYDLLHYRVSKWKSLVSKKFEIQKIIKPSFYPYPDYVQFFPIIKSKWISSSVFFICKK